MSTFQADLSQYRASALLRVLQQQPLLQHHLAQETWSLAASAGSRWWDHVSRGHSSKSCGGGVALVGV
jgi:hypothetical protein